MFSSSTLLAALVQLLLIISFEGTQKNILSGVFAVEFRHSGTKHVFLSLLIMCAALGCVIEGGFLTDSNWNMIKSCADE